MMEKIRKLKNQKGFTLVELIVVLVILAILAALLVPALTGYIDKANNEKIVATTRQVVMAAQTEVSEAYGKSALTDGTITITTTAITDSDANANIKGADIISLAEVGTVTTTDGKAVPSLKNGITSITIKFNKDGHVTGVILVQGKTCTYTEGETDGNNGAYDVQ